MFTREMLQDTRGERPRLGAGMLLGGCALLAVLFNQDALPEHTDPVAAGMVAMASCDGVDIEVINATRRVVRVAANFHVQNGARFEGMTYTFEENKVSTTVTHSNPVTYDYPDWPEAQRHTIYATVNYAWGSKIYGGLPVCSKEVVFSPGI